MCICVQFGIRPELYVLDLILYLYMYMNMWGYVHSRADDLRLSRWSSARAMKQVQSESEAGLEPRDTETSKTKKGSQPTLFLLGAAEGGKGLADGRPSVYGWAGLLHWKDRRSSRGKKVIVLYKQWCTYLVLVIRKYIYRYVIPNQQVNVCILCLYMYISCT